MIAWRKLAVTAAIVAACAGAALATTLSGYVRLPLVTQPKPSGAWPVGTVRVTLSSAPKCEPVVAQIWYPAPAGTRGPGAPYVRANAPLRDRFVGAFIRTRAVADVPVAAGRFPVIVSIAGWGGRREQLTSLATDLASNGYIVAGIDDICSAEPLDFTTADARARSIATAERKLGSEARAVERVVAGLHSIDGKPGRLYRHLDLRRIGLLGFSFGGAVAAEAARRNAEIRAAVNLDGWLFGDALAFGVGRPFLVMSAPLSPKRAGGRNANDADRTLESFDRDNEARQLAGLRRHGGFFVTIDGTDHYNFTDAGWLPSVRHSGMGPIDGRRATKIVTAYVLEFFDRTLKGRAAPLFAGRASVDAAARVLAFRTPLETQTPLGKPPFR